MYSDIRLTKEGGYFDLRGYLKYLKLDLTKSFLLMINCERNTGKSTSSWEYIMDFLKEHNFEKKFVYLRNSMEQIKHAIRDFNQRYKDKFVMTGTFIYRLIWGFKRDKNDEETGPKLVIDRNEVGVVTSISTGLTIKSGTFPNYGALFYDEYNDNLIVPRIYEKFIQICKTIKRFSEPFHIFMIGNKENANNEFMVKMGVTRAPNSASDFIVYPFKDDKQTVFVDVGFNTYAHLKASGDLINKLATLDDRSNRYLNEAGYINDFSDDVINFKKQIFPTIGKPIALLFKGECIYLVGYFDSETKMYLHEIDQREAVNMEKLKLPNIIASFEDSVAAVTKTGVTRKRDIARFALMIYKANQKGNLFYSSFDIKSTLNFFIARCLERNKFN